MNPPPGSMWVVLRLHLWEDLESNAGKLHGTPHEGSHGYMPVFNRKEDAEKYGPAVEIQETEKL